VCDYNAIAGLVHPRVSRNAPPGICKATGKISHTTRDDAEAALKSVVWRNQSRGESDRSAGLNVYPCDRCDGWHFGHRSSIAIVWHYTTGKLAEEILDSGELHPRRAHKATAKQLRRMSPAERKRIHGKWSAQEPLLWFSRRKDWEPSVIQIAPSEPFPQAPPAGRCWDEVYADGLFRFGTFASVATLRWGDFLRRNPMPSDLRDALTRRGDPTEWLATDRSIPHDQWRPIEMYYRGAWVRFEDLDDGEIDGYLHERPFVYFEAWKSLVEKLGGTERVGGWEFTPPAVPLTEPERVLYEDIKHAQRERGVRWRRLLTRT
jgi:hypothetical protein